MRKVSAPFLGLLSAVNSPHGFDRQPRTMLQLSPRLPKPLQLAGLPAFFSVGLGARADGGRLSSSVFHCGYRTVDPPDGGNASTQCSLPDTVRWVANGELSSAQILWNGTEKQVARLTSGKSTLIPATHPQQHKEIPHGGRGRGVLSRLPSCGQLSVCQFQVHVSYVSSSSFSRFYLHS